MCDNYQTLLLKCCTLPKFHVIDDQNTHDLLQVIEVANARDQIAFDCIPFIFNGSLNEAGYICAVHA